MLLPIQSTPSMPPPRPDSGDPHGLSGTDFPETDFQEMMDQRLESDSPDESSPHTSPIGVGHTVFPCTQAHTGRLLDGRRESQGGSGEFAWLPPTPDWGFLNLLASGVSTGELRSLESRVAASDAEKSLDQESGEDRESAKDPPETDPPEGGIGAAAVPMSVALVPTLVLPAELSAVETGTQSGEVAISLPPAEVDTGGNEDSVEAHRAKSQSPSREGSLSAIQLAEGLPLEGYKLPGVAALGVIGQNQKPPIPTQDISRVLVNPPPLGPSGHENPPPRVASQVAGELAVSAAEGESPAEAFALRITPSQPASEVAAEAKPVVRQLHTPVLQVRNTEADGRHSADDQSGSDNPGTSQQSPHFGSEKAANRQPNPHRSGDKPGQADGGSASHPPHEKAPSQGIGQETRPTVSVRGATHEASSAPARDESSASAPWSSPWGNRVWESARLDAVPIRAQIPMREIDLRLPIDNQLVDVQLRERAGVLDVSVRSEDPALAREMQAGVGDLIRNLESSGYDAMPRVADGGGNEEVLPPVSGRDPATEAGAGNDAGEANPGEHTHQGDSSAGQGRQQGRQRRQRNTPADPFRIEGFSNNKFSIDPPATGAGLIRAFEGGSSR